MIIQNNETKAKTINMKSTGAGRFAVSADTQRAMLTAFLNVAASTLKTLAEVKAAGIEAPNTLPVVVIEYRKMTKAKPRVANQDFRPMPGINYTTHIGKVVKVARNKQGEIYFTLLDSARAGDKVGFTAIKLGGIESFSFQDPEAQAKALEAALAA